MTQLVELRNAISLFNDAGIELFAISYDDRKALTAFASEYQIPYPLLSDIDSKVIDRFGIRNSLIKPGDGIYYGIPFPGSYVVDENGVVMEKFFSDSHKQRPGPELLIDAALGRIGLHQGEPNVATESPVANDEVKISVTLHGGAIKQGIERRVVIRFEVPDGLHIYDQPVPAGMTATRIMVSGPTGLVIEPVIKPPTTKLFLKELDLELNVWSGTVDLQIPIWATSELASESRALASHETKLDIEIEYQACNDETCLLPCKIRLQLDVPIEEMHVQKLRPNLGHQQKEGTLNSKPHMRRLIRRKIMKYPFRSIRFLLFSAKLKIASLIRSFFSGSQG